MTAWYNEIDPYAAQWLRNLIKEGLIADGDVDTRSIADVKAADLDGYTQCHFFAGIGGWSRALRLAGWPDDRPVWTGSCPCQPFSLAGRQQGFADERHLWPAWRRLISRRRPATVLGEQVASAAAWLRLVRGELEAMGYAVGAIPVEAASAGAYHFRDRYWFVAHGGSERLSQRAGDRRVQRQALGSPARQDTRDACALVDAARLAEREPYHQADADADGWQAWAVSRGAGDIEWAIGADGKARRVKPGVRLLADGVPARVAKLRAFGNAIVPQAAAAFIKAIM